MFFFFVRFNSLQFKWANINNDDDFEMFNVLFSICACIRRTYKKKYMVNLMKFYIKKDKRFNIGFPLSNSHWSASKSNSVW